MFSISSSALLRYAHSLSGGSSKQGAAKHKTPYLFSFKVAFINLKAKLLGGLASFEILPENLLIFNFATLVTFQEHNTHRNLLLLLYKLKLKRAKLFASVFIY